MKKGESLEKLVGLIETAISGRDDIEVAWNKKLTDKTTGQPRQFDVLIRTPSGPRNLLTGIECRDKSRPVTVNEIEGYVRKCRDTGVDRPAIATTAGFTKTARVKARFHGVECIDLTEVGQVDWLLGPSFPMHHFRDKHTSWYFEPEPGLNGDKSGYRVVDSNGKELSVDALKSIVVKIKEDLFNSPGRNQAGTKVFRFDPKGLFVIDKEGTKVPVALAQATIEFVIDKAEVPLSLKIRMEQESDFPPVEVADGAFELGGIKGNITMVNQPGEGIKIFYRASEKKKRKSIKKKPIRIP